MRAEVLQGPRRGSDGICPGGQGSCTLQVVLSIRGGISGGGGGVLWTQAEAEIGFKAI